MSVYGVKNMTSICDCFCNLLMYCIVLSELLAGIMSTDYTQLTSFTSKHTCTACCFWSL